MKHIDDPSDVGRVTDVIRPARKGGQHTYRVMWLSGNQPDIYYANQLSIIS